MQNSIICPSCQHEFSVEKVIETQVREGIQKQVLEQQKKLQQQFEAKQNELLEKEKKFELAKQNENEIFQKKLVEREAIIKKQIEEKSTNDFHEKMKLLEDENRKKEEQLKVARMLELEFRKKTQELVEKQETMELEVQRKMDAERKLIEESARKKEAESQFMKLNEKDLLIQTLQKNLDEMNRKVEQGSMQSQGETQEIALENLLQTAFPFDKIEEVGKGVRGADCIQLIRNNTGKECGKIIYESKRTKDFKQEWIDKLKADMRNAKADVAVIVTETMPKDLEQFGLKDDVWICNFNEVRALATVLRNGVIKIEQAKASQENKGDKMHTLYDYLIGNEFYNHISAVVQGFTAMKAALEKEKAAMNKLWKEREKQIELVSLNTTSMYGSIQGIAGNSVKEIEQLELGNSSQNLIE
ncbi:MAG: hypothetical protein RJA07_1647 [Bacteroidota bacterium]|jgi:hypothetical protein